MTPKPTEKAKEKDPKKDKKYKDGSNFKEFYTAPIIPPFYSSPEESLAARNLWKQLIRAEKERRMKEPRNKNKDKGEKVKNAR